MPIGLSFSCSAPRLPLPQSIVDLRHRSLQDCGMDINHWARKKVWFLIWHLMGLIRRGTELPDDPGV